MKLQVYQTPRMAMPRIVDETGRVIAECTTNGCVVFAMAAAPELLEACKTYRQLANNISVAITDEQVTQAVRAFAEYATQVGFIIAKAEGRQ